MQIDGAAVQRHHWNTMTTKTNMAAAKKKQRLSLTAGNAKISLSAFGLNQTFSTLKIPMSDFINCWKPSSPVSQQYSEQQRSINYCARMVLPIWAVHWDPVLYMSLFICVRSPEWIAGQRNRRCLELQNLHLIKVHSKPQSNSYFFFFFNLNK